MKSPSRHSNRPGSRVSGSRRSGFTVALVGPDGAGKTTIARRLERELDLPAKYLYMGVNAESSNRLLPTTRLVRRLRRRRGYVNVNANERGDVNGSVAATHTARHVRVASSVRSAMRLVNRLAEEWYRQLMAWYWVARGTVVVFDRHFFFDYYAHDVANQVGLELSRRIHGAILNRVYPRPDLVIFLDAPAEVLYARKPEGTPELLQARRQEYVDLAAVVDRLVVVDTVRDPEQVIADVKHAVMDFAEEMREGRRSPDARDGSTGMRIRQ